MERKEYYKVGEVAELLGVSPQTVRNWDESGKLPHHHTGKGGYRFFSAESITQFLRNERGNPETTATPVGYCRVDAADELKLEQQVYAVESYLAAQGRPFEIIKDVGYSGDYKRKGLRDLLKGMKEGRFSKVVVWSKGCLADEGYDLIEYLAELCGCVIEVINHTKSS